MLSAASDGLDAPAFQSSTELKISIPGSAHGFSDAFSSKARGVGEAPRRHVIKRRAARLQARPHDR